MFTIIALCLAVVAFLAASLALPASIALWQGDLQALEVFISFGVFYGLLAMLGMTVVLPRTRRLNRAGLFHSSIAMWITLALAAVPPFLLLESNGLNGAFFEATSAITTLGVSAHNAQQISASMSTYRVILAWQGGLLTLLLAIFVLGRTRAGGTPDRHIRLVLHSFESRDPRLWQTFGEVFIPYASLTLAGAALLTIVRVPAGDALAIAAGALSTNGFLPITTGASVLNNAAGEIIMMGLMLLGATSILWQRALVTRRWRQISEQPETAQYLGVVFVLSLVAVISGFLVPGPLGRGWHASLNRAFDMVSVLTTTGITHDMRFGMGLPFEMIIGMAFVGGCAYSTAGGLKFFRLAAMLRHSANDLARLVHPHVVLGRGDDATGENFRRSKAIWSAFYLSLLTVLLSAMFFSLQGFGLDYSLSLAIGGFSTTASLVNSVSGPGNIAQWPNETLATLSLVALAGRIELLAVLAAIGRSDW